MDADMDRTKVIICYLRPLLRLENPQLERFIHRSASSILYYHESFQRENVFFIGSCVCRV